MHNPELFILKFLKRKRVYFYLLAAMSPKIHLYYVCRKRHFLDMLWRHFSALDFLYGKEKEEIAKQFAKIGAKGLQKGEIPCVVYPFFPKKSEEENRQILQFLQKEFHCRTARVDVQVIRRREQFERKFFKRAKATFHFFLE